VFLGLNLAVLKKFRSTGFGILNYCACLFQGEETPKHGSVTVTGSMKKSQIQKFIAKFLTTNIL
jgi:hypothetical protein